MWAVILIFLGSLLLTGFGTPFVRQMAMAIGFVDAPSKRKLHVAPMPLMGGVAIFGGAIVLLAVYFGRLGNTRVLGQLFGAALISAIGLLDDKRPLSAKVKFAVQAAAFILVIWLGTSVRIPGFPLWLNWVLTFIWFSIITNAINFLDNMDGLCAGVAAVAAAFIVLMANFSGQFFVGPLAAAILGACLGFLRYNFKPARIFMGDAGSLLLGYMLASMSLQLRFPDNSTFVTWMVPLFILGVPLFDLTLVSIARLKRGVNPLTAAGKDHTSHRLVRMGLSQREAVLTIYLLGGIYGMIALFIIQADLVEGYMIGVSAAIISLFGIYRLLKREELMK